MNPSDVRLDKHGFPLPYGFEEPAASPPPLPRKAKALRVLFILLGVAAVLGALFRARLAEPVRGAIADWLISGAEEKFANDDLRGALRDLDRAAAWNEKSPAVFALRGRVRLENLDLEGSLADFNRLVDLMPRAVSAYRMRAVVQQRLSHHEAAVRDMNEAIRLNRVPDAVLLNDRAYFRALGRLELDAALDDIQQAIRLHGDDPSFLDTRGYIYFLQERYEEAMLDLDHAIKSVEGDRAAIGGWMGNDPRNRRRAAQMKRNYDQTLAVMYHHRGEIHERMGHAVQSQVDLRRGDQLGYNPAVGVN